MKPGLQLLTLLSFYGCGEKNPPIIDPLPLYDSTPVVYPLVTRINEVSGIADSKTIPGHLWLHEDSGHPAQLYLLSHQGAVQGKVWLKGARNRDWEDMALSGGNLYVADIGDNGKIHPDYTIYVFPEPDAATDTVTNYQTIRFKYPDGSHDAEAFLVDPATRDIYLITKNDRPSAIYHLPYPYANTVMTATAVGSLTYTGVVSAALSADGRQLIVKTYMALHHYYRKEGETLLQALQKQPVILPYQIEPQGEAVCFAQNGTGYFTLSEKSWGQSVSLYFYRKQK